MSFEVDDLSHGENKANSERFGRFLTHESTQQRLGVSSRDLQHLVDCSLIIQVETSDLVKVYPELQFTSKNGLVKGLPELNQILLLSAEDSWVVLYWLTSPLEEFQGRTAMEVLAGGNHEEVTAVMELAEADAECWLTVR